MACSPPDQKTGQVPLKARIKAVLKTVPILVRAKRRLWSLFDGSRGATQLNVLHAFPLYIPCSSGSYKARAHLTIQTANRIFPALASLAEAVNQQVVEVRRIDAFAKEADERQAAIDLKELLDRYGSDKATHHGYHHLYGAILKNRREVRAILEIGLGTNHTDVVSNMGSGGSPGASLRAFRAFCDGASVYGADVDRRILFEEDRIQTYFVDQTKPKSLEALATRLPDDLDLVIDDGLHSPDANVSTLRFGLRKVRVGGWVVIEDIGANALPLWRVVAALLPERYGPRILDAGGTFVFAVERLR